ncbi:endonuclease/exonuclease/phosphatase family protein [Robiginitalea sediminis]|uniref:endonuclease/exonuclease/phosphatase family protein n=1 Tax=Robiginitalea sediminis TaxID=1982593 RepID=UPI001E445890|nr:endonuclease/exonuclease/phosphatase family protein [Robiginitalea sediminis]
MTWKWIPFAFVPCLFTGCNTPELSQPPPGRYQVRTVAFYNVENLFDTVNDTLVFDEEYTPGGGKGWTRERYEAKLLNLATVLEAIGKEESGRSPDLIGLCEVENSGVIEDLLLQDPLREIPYGIVHFDSPDHRGIDVALLYNRNSFSVLDAQSRRLVLRDTENNRKYTRDQLVVHGTLDGDPVYLSVNHWPSRSGGELASAPYRKQAAALQRRILDSILREDPGARFLSMGDYNDNPPDASLRFGLGTTAIADSIPKNLLYNPMENWYRSGEGSLAYRDQWSLFDQILVGHNWLMEKAEYRFWKAGIFRPGYLITPDGPYRGYPLRTYAGGVYLGGYSDHFPVYAFLIKPAGPTSE